jgi:hypothetical protein
MQYIKHYWVDNISNQYCCHTNNPKEKRHPNKEFAGLDVKIWLQDVEGIDVCLSEVPDTTSVSTITDEGGTNCVKVLTLEEFNTVATPYFEAQQLSAEARTEEDEIIKAYLSRLGRKGGSVKGSCKARKLSREHYQTVAQAQRERWQKWRTENGRPATKR